MSVDQMSLFTALLALACAGMDAANLDLVVVATCTPEILCPSVAAMVQHRIGATNAGAFDLNAACSGFVYGTSVVAGMIESGFAERVLLVGAEKLHFAMDYRDRGTSILFGDGAGAAVFEASRDGAGVLAVDLGADGGKGGTMLIRSMGSMGEPSATNDPAIHRLHFEGQAVFKIAVQGIAASAVRVLDRATHDQVAGQVVDGTLHAIPPKLAAETALNDALDYRCGAVEHRAGAQQDEHRGERLPGGVRVTVGDLSEPHCADGDNGLVGGINRAQPKERVADRADYQDADD